MNDDSPIGHLSAEDRERIEKALQEGKPVQLDWGGPATTIGERVRRYLWAMYFNRRAEEMGSPLRVRAPGGERP